MDYIVLAEFDINQGSVVKHQYPHPIPNAEPNTIASYMLPEGGHNRSSDITYFLLNRRKAKDMLALISSESSPLPFLSARYFIP